jgi:hypothetical protein
MTQWKIGSRRAAVAAIALGAAILAPRLAGADPAPAPAAYPAMAPIEAYRFASPADEVALARSAAPPSVSADAEVLTLGAHGYETAAAGKNGFVCVVERAWANDFGDAEFWNPKVRAPICFNPASARSVLSTYLERTKWVLAGASQAEMLGRTKAAIAAGRIRAPEVGAMCYMMSKDGYLNDAGGHWHPHLMFFLPHDAGGAAAWGANLQGSPAMGGDVGLDPAVVYFVVVAHWSDGTPASMGSMGM